MAKNPKALRPPVCKTTPILTIPNSDESKIVDAMLQTRDLIIYNSTFCAFGS